MFSPDPLDHLQNVALYDVNITAARPVRFQSLGFAAGGIDPYVSLFLGTGGGATFLRSFAGSGVGDFNLSEVLAAGDYTVAIGLYSNLSYAENLGTGTLGDGFTGLGGSVFGNGCYELALTTQGGRELPEPGGLLLVFAAGTAAALARGAAGRRHAKPQCRGPPPCRPHPAFAKFSPLIPSSRASPEPSCAPPPSPSFRGWRAMFRLLPRPARPPRLLGRCGPAVECRQLHRQQLHSAVRDRPGRRSPRHRVHRPHHHAVIVDRGLSQSPPGSASVERGGGGLGVRAAEPGSS